MTVKQQRRKLINRLVKLIKPTKVRVELSPFVSVIITACWRSDTTLDIYDLEILPPSKYYYKSMPIPELLLHELISQTNQTVVNEFSPRLEELIKKNSKIANIENSIKLLCQDCDNLAKSLHTNKNFFFEELLFEAEHALEK
jgi:hypothetical protein